MASQNANEAHLAPLHLAHLPPHIQILASLHTSVSNSSEIRSQLLASNHDYDYAFIDATTLLSTTHILTAIFRAVNDWMAGRLKTRNVHSEVVFSLGPNNNIADTLRRFGISDKTTSLIAIKIIDTSSASTSSPPHSASTELPSLETTSNEPSPESASSSPSQTQNNLSQPQIQHFLTTSISGTPLPLTNTSLNTVSDITLIRKLYKLPVSNTNSKKGGGGGKGGIVNGDNKSKTEAEERKELEVQILGIMALKGT